MLGTSTRFPPALPPLIYTLVGGDSLIPRNYHGEGCKCKFLDTRQRAVMEITPKLKAQNSRALDYISKTILTQLSFNLVYTMQSAPPPPPVLPTTHLTHPTVRPRGPRSQPQPPAPGTASPASSGPPGSAASRPLPPWPMMDASTSFVQTPPPAHALYANTKARVHPDGARPLPVPPTAAQRSLTQSAASANFVPAATNNNGAYAPLRAIGTSGGPSSLVPISPTSPVANDADDRAPAVEDRA
ncbi:hypothetical protein FB451DRAFT_1172081 [Mycena latifolia]|nr:hypothetical protein FB451DRAFT_1172081 [Mycena latifolia]